MIPLRILLLCLFLAAGLRAQEPSTTPSSDSSAPPSSSSASDAAAKAAERKKHFEEMKKSLEEKDPAPPPAPASSPAAKPKVQAPTAPFYANEPPVSNLSVTMFVGETQPLQLFDNEGHNLTAQAEWWVNDQSVADLSLNGGTPNLLGKKAGTVFVLAHTKLQTARVILRVMDRSAMGANSVRWNQNLIATHAPLFIVPAIPRFPPR